MRERTPVIICGVNCLSGVTTWADQLRVVMAGDSRYDLKQLYIGAEEPEGYDLSVASVEEAYHILRQLAPAIVIPNYIWELYLIGFEPGIACIGMCHADSEEQYYNPLGWYEPTVAKFIAVSNECAQKLNERLPFRAADIATLPYGIKIPRPLERDYQIRPLRLIYAGRVTQLQKRVWDFIPLVENMLRAKVDFIFDIVGEGDAFSGLKDEVLDRFPPGIVRFQPRIPHSQMAGVWSSHDVFLQVSDFEGTSVSMLEAMAHGAVPVVTAASSGIEGVIHDSENGFVVPIGDMDAMARVLANLAQDQALLATVGRNAYNSAQPYSFDLYRQRFVELLDELSPANYQVDLYQRYGMFGYAHPLYKQRQLIVHQQEQITHLRQGPVRRMIKNGYRRLVAAKANGK
jgi:glycosyltransferase involved in cell wall biosynthesis